MSVLVHTGIITGWIVATMPAAGVAPDDIANHPYFLPPPDRAPSQQGHSGAVRYIALAKPGGGLGEGPRTMGDTRPAVIPDQTLGGGGVTKDTTVGPPATPQPTHDSVYSILEVDTAVARMANSAAPAYPLTLLESHVMGYVQARYTVDTTGFADTSSFIVLKATNPEFITAVRDALPYMRFMPAKIGSTKVRQLVEQQFTFRISDTSAIAAPGPHAKKP
ncbi:MAG: hypothetical protein ACHQWU_10320 [Gemmatimonadales bacterium]